MTKAEFMRGFNVLRAFIDDLPDGMDSEVLEIQAAIKDGADDWDGLALAVDDMCEDWGFPSVFS